jgi:hypothetical protein
VRPQVVEGQVYWVCWPSNCRGDGGCHKEGWYTAKKQHLEC